MVSQERKERKDVATRQACIEEAIRKVEQFNPLHEWRPKQIFAEIPRDHICLCPDCSEKNAREAVYCKKCFASMKNVSDRPIISYRRLLSHLKQLEVDGYIKKSRAERGYYLSKYSLVWKKIVQDSLIHSVMEITPRLEGNDFEELVSRNLRLSTEMAKKAEDKNLMQSPFRKLVRKLKGEDVEEQALKLIETIETNVKQRLLRDIETDVRRRMRRDLEFVESSTEITVLSNKAQSELDTVRLRSAIAEFLYHLMVHERYSRIPHENWIGLKGNTEKEIALRKKLKRVENPGHFLKDSGLHIVVRFDPDTCSK